MEEPALCVLDEAGFVGFAETQPTKPLHSRAIGIVGGLLIPSDTANLCEQELARLFSEALQGHAGKPHAYEVFRDGRHAGAREEVFEFLLSLEKCLVVYEAVHALGVLQDRDSLRKIIDRAREIGGVDPLPEGGSRTRVLTTLYRGILFQVDELCKSIGIPQAKILTDHLDRGLLKEQLAQLRELQSETSTREYTTWSEQTDVVKGRVEVRTPGFDNRTDRIGGVSVDTEHPHLVLASDTVVNSLHRLLREHVDRCEGFPPLHDGIALEGFRLRSRVASIASNYWTDRVLRPCGDSE